VHVHFPSVAVNESEVYSCIRNSFTINRKASLLVCSCRYECLDGHYKCNH